MSLMTPELDQLLEVLASVSARKPEPRKAKKQRTVVSRSFVAGCPETASFGVRFVSAWRGWGCDRGFELEIGGFWWCALVFLRLGFFPLLLVSRGSGCRCQSGPCHAITHESDADPQAEALDLNPKGRNAPKKPYTLNPKLFEPRSRRPRTPGFEDTLRCGRRAARCAAVLRQGRQLGEHPEAYR